MTALPATSAHLRVLRQCFQDQCVEGEVSLGRALIQDALLRFLVRTDYKLEAGGDYNFTVRARF